MNTQQQSDLLNRAMAILQDAKLPATDALALIKDIDKTSPVHRQAQHLRGIIAFRMGDATTAVTLLLDSIQRGESSPLVYYNLAKASARCGNPASALAIIDHCIRYRLEDKFAGAFIYKIAEYLQFDAKAPLDYLEHLFENFFFPLVEWACANQRMELAIGVERAAYEGYVKAVETEAHFARVTERMTPHYQRLGEYWRDTLPPLPTPPATRPYKIGFFIHSASMLAHIEVLLHTLRGYRLLEEQPFTPIIYCFSSRHPDMEAAFAALEVPVVFLSEIDADTKLYSWPRLLALRDIIAREHVQELVWVSLTSIMPLAFSMRMAPVQTFWAMKYHATQLKHIDGYVTGGAITRYRTIHGRQWRNGVLGIDNWYDPALTTEAAALRKQMENYVVAGTLAREEKMLDPTFLAAIVSLLQDNPRMFFLWTGRKKHPVIQRALTQGGVSERTQFIGWVNTRLYAQVLDVFLDSFPFPCGFTLFQTMAAGKPVVISTTMEAEETGLWAFLQPLIDGNDGTDAERRALRDLIGPDSAPLLAIARTPQDFIRLANRLLTDHELRQAAGEASRQLMQRYFSDPRTMGSTYAGHFMELLSERFPSTGSLETAP